MYKIKISPKAQSQLKKLKIQYRDSLTSIVEDLKEDPFIGKPLIRNFIGKYSYRIGIYRIIYRIRIKENLVEIISAGHRSIVYN